MENRFEENPLVRQVADELKGLFNASVNNIRNGDYQAAHALLNQALSVTELLDYHDGTAKVLYNIANLYAVKGDSVEGLKTAALALEKANISGVDAAACQKLLNDLFLTVQKDGIACVKNKDYPRALVCFETGLLHAPEEKKAALEQQITLLRRILDECRGDS